MRRPVQAIAGMMMVHIGSRQAQTSRRGPHLKVVLAAVPIVLSSLVASPALAATITEFPLPTPGSGAGRISTGPDDNLWFTENTGNKIGRITPNGAISEFPLPTPGSGPTGIAAGPDDNLWFPEQLGNKIGRITPDEDEN